MKRRILSLMLALIMILNLIPMTVTASVPVENGDSVYISIGDDNEFILDSRGNPVAYIEVTLNELSAWFATEGQALEDYGLGDFIYDADGDGNYDLTALHLYIYVHEHILGLDWATVNVTGGPGSAYLQSGVFGFEDENLRYDLNGSYPIDEVLTEQAGYIVGATADRIVLDDGDFINVQHYSDWEFYYDPATGFNYFTDAVGELEHSFTVGVNQELQMGIKRGYSDWMSGGAAAFIEVPEFEVFYGTTYGDPYGESIWTDESGMFSLTFTEEGTWYVWTTGGIGDMGTVVSAPAFATVTVTGETVNPNLAYANAVEILIDKIGTVTAASKEAIEAARTAYDALSEEQKALVANYRVLVEAEERLLAIDDDIDAADEVEALINAIGVVNIHSGNRIAKAREAYNQLTEEQKAYVENVSILTSAESTVEALYAEGKSVNHKSIYELTARYINGLGTPTVGSVGGEWMIIDMARAGYECPEGYYQNVVDYVNAKINDKEQLHRAKSTDNSRVILGLTAAGYDVTNVDGHNLLMGLTDLEYLKKQGINGPIWALIAFDCYDYEIPTNPNATTQATRENIIGYILEKQLVDGGWALSGQKADPDMTGMAMQALAPYYNSNAEVKAAVDEAIICLSEMQYANGGFGSVDGTCSESCAQVIVALTALGINPETDPRFVKNGMSVVDAMCIFAIDNGGFEHVPHGGLNGMATEQGQYALVAYFRFLEGKNTLYDMTDVTIRKQQEQTKIEITEGGIKEIPDALKEVGLETSEEVKDKFVETILDKNGDIKKEDIKHYDITMKYTEDGGQTWIVADESHFPSNGKITVVIPYPEGTDSRYQFTVVHMFTSNAYGKTAGDVEIPVVKNTEAGIQFEVTGLSPISVGWIAPDASTGSPITGETGTFGMCFLFVFSAMGLTTMVLLKKKYRVTDK